MSRIVRIPNLSRISLRFGPTPFRYWTDWCNADCEGIFVIVFVTNMYTIYNTVATMSNYSDNFNMHYAKFCE